MAGAWSVGGAPRAATLPTPPATVTGPTWVRCPQCSADNVRVRTSKAGISSLECPACGSTWKETRRLMRVLIVADP